MMINKIYALVKRHQDILMYLVLGALTTVVNYMVYFPLHNWLDFSAGLSNCIAWVVSVAFAYLTNKPFVFKSNDWSSKTVFPELGKFVGCRLGSGLIETLSLLVTVDILSWNGNIVKIVVSILVVILNYVASRWFVFRDKNEE